jgi:hypothetical protein
MGDSLSGRALRLAPWTNSRVTNRQSDTLLKLFHVQQAREEQSNIYFHDFL